MTEIKTATCPGCGSPPKDMPVPLVPSQAFCPSDDCHVLMWDPTKSLAELTADITMTTLPEFVTEKLICAIHGVEEPYTPGVDYKACGECWHVWPTEADFRADVTQLAAEMNSAPDTPHWTPPNDLAKVYSCPLCAHDF